jgi:DUF2075 family protein
VRLWAGLSTHFIRDSAHNQIAEKLKAAFFVVGTSAKSYDAMVKRAKTGFLELVKNTYRVLLSRGLKGCYVYFMDKNTERFVRSRME